MYIYNIYIYYIYIIYIYIYVFTRGEYHEHCRRTCSSCCGKATTTMLSWRCCGSSWAVRSDWTWDGTWDGPKGPWNMAGKSPKYMGLEPWLGIYGNIWEESKWWISMDFPCLGTIPRQDNGADGGGMDLVVEGGGNPGGIKWTSWKFRCQRCVLADTFMPQLDKN